MTGARAVVRVADATVRRDGVEVLRDVSWSVAPGERWVVLGPNGSGKTTLLCLAGGLLHPHRGTVEILGETVGRVDLRALRERIGFTSGAVVRTLRPGLSARDLVLTGRHASLETWWHDYTDADRARAAALLDALGVARVADRPFGVISEGERQQVLLARLLMGEPDLLLLDEPFAGLDLGARERLLARLSDVFAGLEVPAAVLVTHHVEEIPPGVTHALLLRGGGVVAAGPIGDTLTSGALSDAFGLSVVLESADGRWRATARPDAPGAGARHRPKRS